MAVRHGPGCRMQRRMHAWYWLRRLPGCLLSNPSLHPCVRPAQRRRCHYVPPPQAAPPQIRHGQRCRQDHGDDQQQLRMLGVHQRANGLLLPTPRLDKTGLADGIAPGRRRGSDASCMPHQNAHDGHDGMCLSLGDTLWARVLFPPGGTVWVMQAPFSVI